MAFIKENGIELTDEQLESVAGDASSCRGSSLARKTQTAKITSG
jgi:hypothetical protein